MPATGSAGSSTGRFFFSTRRRPLGCLHHPFTAPKGDFDPENPGEPGAEAYDLVWNGVEIGGGSIPSTSRNSSHRSSGPWVSPMREAEERFGFLLEALHYGAPPHGGIAYRVDRFAALLAGSIDP